MEQLSFEFIKPVSDSILNNYLKTYYHTFSDNQIPEQTALDLQTND